MNKKIETLFMKTIAVNTAKLARYGLGDGYQYPPTFEEWKDLLLDYLFFMISNEDNWKKAIADNIDKYEEEFLISFFVGLYVREKYHLTKTEANEIVAEFTDIPEERLAKVVYYNLMNSDVVNEAIKRDSKYEDLFEGYIEE